MESRYESFLALHCDDAFLPNDVRGKQDRAAGRVASQHDGDARFDTARSLCAVRRALQCVDTDSVRPSRSSASVSVFSSGHAVLLLRQRQYRRSEQRRYPGECRLSIGIYVASKLSVLLRANRYDQS